jgi:hypothetical protein
MISTALLNLIVSIVAIGILAAVMRCAYLIADGRMSEERHHAQEGTTLYELERAA